MLTFLHFLQPFRGFVCLEKYEILISLSEDSNLGNLPDSSENRQKFASNGFPPTVTKQKTINLF
jgi:hypothetical protein